MRIHNGGPGQSLNEIVLFPFDDHSLPFQHGVQLQLLGHSTPCGRTKVVLGLGPEGAPDSVRVVYYGAVRQVGDEYWMWYLGQGPDETWFERVCFAKSRDGYHWERPNLGLVEYHGSRNNNLVDLYQGQRHVQSCVVFYEPDDPDPARRFKMAYQTREYQSRFAVAYSADGLTWQPSPNNPVGSWLEMSGGMRRDDCYYLTGQGGAHAGGIRQLVTYVSYDFEHWSQASAMGLRRSNLPPRPVPFGGNAGEQVHLGASLWNRGNVVLGFYGMWHGHPSNDRRLLTMDLGLAVSNDGLHYREPGPDFPIVSAAEDGWDVPPRGHTAVHFPALVQGQGFENIGDETLFWYAPWPEQDSDGVRVATWTRDRLGYFQPFTSRRVGAGESHVVSAPIDLEDGAARVSLNLTGVGDHSQVRVEVLDEQFNPLPGYTREACQPLREAGLRQAVTWQDRDVVVMTGGPVRLRVLFEGLRLEDTRLYAAYLEAAQG
ncbi:MAG: hypothetical protein KIT87_07185 [Anaerolineae bacterium]|nr:hypothetical protein [Anaerolineae bacterium]